MSAKKQITLRKGIAGVFICTLAKFHGTNSPKEFARAEFVAFWYADAEDKAAGRTLVDPFVVEIPNDVIINANKNPYKACYEYLSQPGRMLEGSVEC